MVTISPFDTVAKRWLVDRGKSLDGAIKHAEGTNPDLLSDIRGLRVRKRPTKDKAVATFLADYMRLSGEDLETFLGELGIANQPTRAPDTPPDSGLGGLGFDGLTGFGYGSGLGSGSGPETGSASDKGEDAEPEPAKKKRGRPPGSKNKPKTGDGKEEVEKKKKSKGDKKPVADALPIASTPAPQHISHEEIADRIEVYADSLGDKIRPKQRETLNDIIADIRKGNIGGVVKRPTGTGKTVIFSIIVAALKDLALEKRAETGTQQSILILVPNNFLEEQTIDTLTKQRTEDTDLPLLSSLDDPNDFAIQPDEIAAYGDQNTTKQKTETLTKPVVVMTFAAYESKLKREELDPNQIMYAVIDEVDMAKDANEKTDKRTEKVRRLTTATYSHGFSATTEYVSPKHGPKTINDTLYDRDDDDYVHKTRIKQSAEDKEIAPIKNVLLMTHLKTEAEKKSGHEYTDKQTTKIVDSPGRDAAIIEKVFSHTDSETGIAFRNLDQIWFCKGVEHAHRVSDSINDMMRSPQELDLHEVEEAESRHEEPKYPFAIAIDGSMKDESWVDSVTGVKHPGRKKILSLHREGKIPVICNADLLIRGFNSKRTQLAVMTYPSMSPAKVEQIGGRIGRLDEGNPNKLGFMVNVLDQDTVRAKVFSDAEIAESAFIGHVEGNQYAARPISEGQPERVPDFAQLHSGTYGARELDPAEMEMVSVTSEVKARVTKHREDGERNAKRWFGLSGFQSQLKENGIPGNLGRKIYIELNTQRKSRSYAPDAEPEDYNVRCFGSDVVLPDLHVKYDNGISIDQTATDKLIASLASISDCIIADSPEHCYKSSSLASHFKAFLQSADAPPSKVVEYARMVAEEAGERFYNDGVTPIEVEVGRPKQKLVFEVGEVIHYYTKGGGGPIGVTLSPSAAEKILSAAYGYVGKELPAGIATTLRVQQAVYEEKNAEFLQRLRGWTPGPKESAEEPSDNKEPDEDPAEAQLAPDNNVQGPAEIHPPIVAVSSVPRLLVAGDVPNPEHAFPSTLKSRLAELPEPVVDRERFVTWAKDVCGGGQAMNDNEAGAVWDGAAVPMGSWRKAMIKEACAGVDGGKWAIIGAETSLDNEARDLVKHIKGRAV